MKSKRSRKDKARRIKPFNPLVAMESKWVKSDKLNLTATPVRLRICDSSGVELVNTEIHPIKIPQVNPVIIFDMFEPNKKEMADIYDILANRFKIYCDTPPH